MTIGTHIQSLYTAIPEFDCKPGCFECCGPVPCHDWELEKLGVETGEFIAAKNLKVIEPGKCQFIKDGKCSVYERRPLMCRLFGTIEDLQCPYGMRPDILLTKKQASGILREYLLLFTNKNGGLKDAFAL